MAKTMRTKRKLNKLLSAAGILFCAICVLTLSVLTFSAAEESGSLTLRCVFSVENGKRVLAGDEYSLVKIADAEISKSSTSYRTLPRFENYDCNWKKQTSSKMTEKAAALASYCESKGYFTASKTTDKNGEAEFKNLSVGLYLVARTKVASKNSDYSTKPLLLYVPHSVNGRVIYDIVATPKFSYNSLEDNSLHNGDADRAGDARLPQTGQLQWPIGVLAVLGCFLILGGSLLIRKENSDEK